MVIKFLVHIDITVESNILPVRSKIFASLLLAMTLKGQTVEHFLLGKNNGARIRHLILAMQYKKSQVICLCH